MEENPSFAGRFRLRNWRVRWRLIALILIPTAVAVGLGALRVGTAMTNAEAYDRVERKAELGSAISHLSYELSGERDRTAGYIAKERPRSALPAVRKQYAEVDQAAAQVRGLASGISESHGEFAVEKATNVINRLDDLKAVRDFATKSETPVLAVVDKYSEISADLLSFNDEIAQGTSEAELAETVRTMGSLSRATEQTSRQRAILYAALERGSIEPAELEALVAARAQQDSELAAFKFLATVEQRQTYEDTVIGPDVDRSENMRLLAITLARGGEPTLSVAPGGRDGATWFDSMNTRLDAMHAVEQRMSSEITEQSHSLKENAERSALLDGGLVIVVLALILAFTMVVAQSLVRPLRRLRTGALEVAGSRLPGLVRRLRDPDGAAAGIEVEPIEVDSTDEIGEVARAFDEVHREAVRLAANEAMLRGNINAMFVNLSRRSQSLIERQLRLIEDLEQGEQDADRLSNLFKLDHLATRMRRNCENLLVLGGQDQVRRWNRPVPLIDVVRASLSEVEQYERVNLRVQGEVSIAGPVVNDLVHLVAELIENAASFSPEHTKVAVSGHLLSGGGAMLQIGDNGVGLSPEELHDANWRLANPPVIDVSVSRRMGLFVVGRLAARHGIRVELRSALSGGLTAFVLLPAGVILQGPAAGESAPRGFDPPREPPAIEPPSVLPQRRPGRDAPVGVGAVDSPGFEALLGGERFGGEPERVRPVQPATAEPHPLGAFAPMAETPRPPASAPPPPREPYDSASTDEFRVPADPMPAGGHRMPDEPMPTGPYPRPREPVPSGDYRMPGESMSTGDHPIPREPVAAARAAQGPSVRRERLPIFDAIESEWFRRREERAAAHAGVSGGRAWPSPGPSPGSSSGPSMRHTAGPPTGPATSRESRMPSGIESWKSSGDEGWRAAEAARSPAAAGKTAAGLPKRVPGGNQVPGSAGTLASQPAQPQSADAVRTRLANFQQGLRQGRAKAQAESETDGA